MLHYVCVTRLDVVRVNYEHQSFEQRQLHQSPQTETNNKLTTEWSLIISSRAPHICNKLCGRRGCGRYGIPRPRAITQLHKAFISGHGSWYRMLQSPTKFEVKFVGDTLSVSAVIDLVTLTFDLLTSNLVRVIARVWATFWTILMFWGLFVLDLWAKLTPVRRTTRLSDLTFNLGAHGACQIRVIVFHLSLSVYPVWRS